MNVYVHFPFCRSKCAYCALFSRAGASADERRAYVRRLADDLAACQKAAAGRRLATLYFGGGTPLLCDLRPVFDVLDVPPTCEFTVELHPLDATPDNLRLLRDGGVNRVSMGVQSFDDDVLRAMGRAHRAADALAAWRAIRAAGFDNAGIDLICGWPAPDAAAWRRTVETAAALAPDHCSVYTLILEPGTRIDAAERAGRFTLPSDAAALDELYAAEDALAAAGLARYEISSFARPGRECRHNLAVWRGEDYTGVGDGACSREGDAVSRVIFRLRLLKEGLDPDAAAKEWPELAPRLPVWRAALERARADGLVRPNPAAPAAYVLTRRGAEVCDAILADLV